MEAIKLKIETLIEENAPDFEIAKLLKADIKEYFGTLEESFSQNSGKNFLVKHFTTRLQSCHAFDVWNLHAL